MRISDWSSDVCSSDLLRRGGLADPEPDCDHHRLRRAQQGARRRLGRRRRFLAAGDRRREYRPPLHLEPVAKPAMTDSHRKTTSRRRLLRPAVLAMAVVFAALTGWFTYRTTFAEAADSGFEIGRAHV